MNRRKLYATKGQSSQIVCNELQQSFMKKEKYILYPYEKAVCQGVLLKMPQLESETLSYDELKKIASLRNDGRLGSSGK